MPTLKLQGYFTECGYNSPLTVGSHLPAKPRHSIGCKSEPGSTPSPAAAPGARGLTLRDRPHAGRTQFRSQWRTDQQQ